MAKRKFEIGDRARVKAGNGYMDGAEGTIQTYHPGGEGYAAYYGLIYDEPIQQQRQGYFYAYQMDKIIPPPDLGHIW